MDFKISLLNYSELMLPNVLVFTPHLLKFDTLSEHSQTIRAERLFPLYQETKLGLIIQSSI